MRKRLTTLAVLLGATSLLTCALPVASASADSPWWDVLSGSRPSNLWEPKDANQVQEVTAEKFNGQIFAAAVEIEGTTVGCLGTGEIGFFPPLTPANTFCEEQTGYPASETAAEFEEMLEEPEAYGPGQVEVTGGPVTSDPFQVITDWGVAPVELTPLLFSGVIALGSAESEIVSEGSGLLTLILTNLGSAPVDATSTPVRIVDELPEGVAAYAAEGVGGYGSKAGAVECDLPSSDLVECEFEGELPSYESIEVEVRVVLEGSPPSAGAPGKVTVSGGDAPTESAVQAINVSDAPVPFGVDLFTARAEEEGGESTRQAGAHPFQFVNTVQFNSGRQTGATRREARVEQPALLRNTRVTLPRGLVGNATATATCPMSVFLERAPFNDCPEESVVGAASVTIVEAATYGLRRIGVPIFNLPPARGEPARFGFAPVSVPVVIDTSVDPENDYRITGTVRNTTQTVEVISATIALWGNPGDPRHDDARGWNCFLFNPSAYPGECGEPLSARTETPFLRMPVSCDAGLNYPLEIEPWNAPLGSLVARDSSASGALTGCNRVPFDPGFALTPTSKAAESPTGLDAEVKMPNKGLLSPNAEASEAQFKKAVVTLPEGMTVNPSQAEGLGTCSPDDYARERYDSEPGEGCPEDSKIGNVEIATPLLEEDAKGALYVAEPNDNPFDSLIAVYLVARIPERGILVKQAGEVVPDEDTGRLVTTFDDVPQLPFDSFELHFREGARAPLVTPPRCGTHRTQIRFMPWNAQDPDNPSADEIVTQRVPFEIERGTNGADCPSGTPFAPGFVAGTLNNQAGAYSPVLMRLTRQDGMQDITKFSAVLPPGLAGRIAGIPWCPDPALAAAAHRDGEEELDNPSCPAASKLGRVLAGAGVGSVLTYVDGSIYLAGPYKGAPLSIAAIVPAVAGPFDVGTVVTRVGLRLNPKSGQVEVDGAASDPIPHILEGIPLKVRDIRVLADRPAFTLNPTSCAPSNTFATIWGGGSNAFSAADDVPFGIAARFQAASCASLAFEPKLAIRLKGGVRRGAHPALRAVVTPRPGDANFDRAVVTLPRSAFLEQAHIRTICTRVQFAAGPGHGALCPKGAQYGFARAWSPLLAEPAQGPVYLRSSDNQLPDLVVALKGPASAPVDVELSARIDSVKGGIRSTFTGIPDLPVSRFILNMQGGKKGLIVNSRHLCHKPRRNRATSNLRGQNGRLSKTKPRVVATTCAKRRKAKRARAKRAARRSAARVHLSREAG